MKRRRPPTAAELDAARQAASDARVEAGLPVEDSDFCVPRGQRYRVTADGRVVAPKGKR